MKRIGSAIDSVLLVAGLLVVAFAFFYSLWVGVGTIGEEWRAVIILEANPDAYVQEIWFILQYGIFPIVAGLVLCIIEFIVRRRTRTESPSRLLLIRFLAGILLIILGILGCLSTYHSYTTLIGEVNQHNVKAANGSLQITYMGYELVSILWIVTGVFLSLTSDIQKKTEKERVHDHLLCPTIPRF